MALMLRFPPVRSLRLEPFWPQPWEITCIHYVDYFTWEVPRFEYLSIFEHKLLNHLAGWRHLEIDSYLDKTMDDRGQRICASLYGNMPIYKEGRYA